MKRIAKEMLISELIDQVENKDAVVDKLMECGMHCLGCMMAHGETIEEAAMVHGLDVDVLIDELNKVAFND